MMTYLLLLLFCLFDQPGCRQVSFRGLRERAIKEEELEKIEGQDKLPSLFFSFNSTQFYICPPPRRKDGDKNIIKW